MSKLEKIATPFQQKVIIVLLIVAVALISLTVYEAKAQKADMFDAGLNQELQIIFTNSKDAADQRKPGSLVILSKNGLVKDQPARVILTDFSGRSTEFVFTPTEVDYDISNDISKKNSVELKSSEGWFRKNPLKQKLENADISVKLCLYTDVYDAIYND